MNGNRIEREVLSAAVEDYTGLWEILWQLNTDYPETPPEENRRIAARAIASLADRGLVDLYLGTAFPAGARRIDPAQRGQIMHVDAYWNEPAPHAEHVRLAATDAGEKQLYGKSAQP
jgi:hypothetical protein